VTLDELVVELKLDPKHFTEGQKSALEAFKKTDDEFQKRLKNLEDLNKKTGASFGTLTNGAEALLSTLAGAGMAALARDAVNAGAATGRLATNIGVATDDLSAFGRVVERNGGSADTAMQSLKGLADQVARMNNFGEQSDDFQLFRGTIGAQGLDALQTMEKFAAYAEKHRGDPAGVNVLGQKGGLDQGSINTLLKGAKQYREELARAKLGAVSKEQADKLAKMQGAWVTLGQVVKTVASDVTSDAEPAFSSFSKTVSDLADNNRKLAASLGWVLTALTALGSAKVAAALLAWISRGMTKIGAPGAAGLGKIAAGLGLAAAAPGKLIGKVAGGGNVVGTAIGAAAVMKEDSQSGNKLRTWLRSKLGIEDPGEAAPWAGSKPNKPPTSPAGGSFAPPEEREAFYRAEAAKRGITPNQAMLVTLSEGFKKYVGDRGSSFGDWQLHYGKVASGGMAVGGLGDEFTKKTGLDARDPSTWKEQATFSLDWAKSHGWGAWHGWKGDKMAGIGGGTTQMTFGDINVTSDSKSPRDHGRIVVDEIKSRLKDSASIAVQANTGLN
jgi:hypothetical protein